MSHEHAHTCCGPGQVLFLLYWTNNYLKLQYVVNTGQLHYLLIHYVLTLSISNSLVLINNLFCYASYNVWLLNHNSLHSLLFLCLIKHMHCAKFQTLFCFKWVNYFLILMVISWNIFTTLCASHTWGGTNLSDKVHYWIANYSPV